MAEKKEIVDTPIDPKDVVIENLTKRLEQLENKGTDKEIDPDSLIKMMKESPTGIISLRVYKDKPIVSFDEVVEVVQGTGNNREVVQEITFETLDGKKHTIELRDWGRLSRKEFKLVEQKHPDGSFTQEKVYDKTGRMINISEYDAGVGKMILTGAKVPEYVEREKTTYKVDFGTEVRIIDGAFINS